MNENMNTNYIYTDPVSKLIKLGTPEAAWQDYSALGIDREDITELIRLLQDDELRLMVAPKDLGRGEVIPEWYAQVHAWRALAQLQAVEAIPALLGILHQIDDDMDDWLSGEAEDVFVKLGTPAVQPLGDYLADEDNPLYARSAASSSLAAIGNTHPGERDRCVEAIATVLGRYENNDEGLNGFLIGDLVEMKAVEQIDLIKRAFEAGAVDEMMNGDVEDVMIDLGLLEERITPARPWYPLSGNMIAEPETPVKRANLQRKQEKNKRKQEKKSRKKNRKRK